MCPQTRAAEVYDKDCEIVDADLKPPVSIT